MYYKYIILHNNTSLFFKYQFFTLKINYKIQRNAKKYKEMQRNAKKCKEMQRNAKKCKDM